MFNALPDADSRIVEAFMKIGLFSSGGMGMAGLSWQEIKAFSDQSTIELDGWESEMIHMMSSNYVAMHNKASDKMATPAPYAKAVTMKDVIANRDKVAKQMQAFR